MYHVYLSLKLFPDLVEDKRQCTQQKEVFHESLYKYKYYNSLHMIKKQQQTIMIFNAE